MTRKIIQSLLVISCLSVVPLFAATKATTKMKARVNGDATRLASLLRDAQTSVTVNADVWKTVANEANSLANRLYGESSGNTTARAAARDAREHVRKFREAAVSGDAAGARHHASEAMPFVMKLIDWSM